MRNFVNQAETVASLEHPNLVRLRDVLVYPFSNSNSPVSSMVCLVTDYIDGQTLADYLRSSSSTAKMRLGAAMVALFTPIGIAIDYAHQHGVIHGNLKPSNILLTSRKTAQGQFDGRLSLDATGAFRVDNPSLDAGPGGNNLFPRYRQRLGQGGRKGISRLIPVRPD